jgi:hypothetical protein
LTLVLDRGAEASSRGAVSSASQVLGRGAQAAGRGAARCASHVLDRGAQAIAKTVSCGDTALSHQESKLESLEESFGRTLDRGPQASALTVACGDTALPHQESEAKLLNVASVSRTRSWCPGRCRRQRGAQACAQADVQTAVCGHATLLQQKKNTRQISRRTD